MEPTEEVLVVIQAESGEEIALPLAALDEQHQEVVVESNGTSNIVEASNDCNHFTVLQQHHNHHNEEQNPQHEHRQSGESHRSIQEERQHLQPQQQTSSELLHEQTGQQIISTQDQQELIMSAAHKTLHIEPSQTPRQKQKRKEKLVCLPLSDDDLKLEFQFVEEPVHQVQEEVKRKPRKEYRTKKKLAALEAAKEKEINASNGLEKDHELDNNTSTNTITDDQTNTSVNSSHNHNSKRRRIAKDDKPAEVAQSPPKQQRQRDKSSLHKQPNTNPSPASSVKDSESPLKCQVKLEESIELPPQTQRFDQIHTPTVQSLPERRTRLSNVCRVATGKSYKCHDCGYSTERINNISLHIKKACPKLFANQ